MQDKVFSFSCPPNNQLGMEAIEYLKKYCRNNNINFSATIIKLIQIKVKELKNET